MISVRRTVGLTAFAEATSRFEVSDRGGSWFLVSRPAPWVGLTTRAVEVRARSRWERP